MQLKPLKDNLLLTNACVILLFLVSVLNGHELEKFSASVFAVHNTNSCN